MKKVRCGVCSKDVDSDMCHVEKLSPQEMKALIDQGLEPQDEYYYCKPCWRLMNSEHAPAMMANRIEQQFVSAGVPKTVAKKVADTYRQRLIEMKRKSNGTQA